MTRRPIAGSLRQQCDAAALFGRRTPLEAYPLLYQDRVNFWMVVLEMTIVLLFILDSLLLPVGIWWRPALLPVALV